MLNFHFPVVLILFFIIELKFRTERPNLLILGNMWKTWEPLKSKNWKQIFLKFNRLKTDSTSHIPTICLKYVKYA